jgi:hypothetical protein
MVPTTTWLAAVSLVGTAAAQYFPPTPEGLTVVKSKHEKGVKISYKQVGDYLFSMGNLWIVWSHEHVLNSDHSRGFAKPRQALGRTLAMSTCPQEL